MSSENMTSYEIVERSERRALRERMLYQAQTLLYDAWRVECDAIKINAELTKTSIGSIPVAPTYKDTFALANKMIAYIMKEEKKKNA